MIRLFGSLVGIVTMMPAKTVCVCVATYQAIYSDAGDDSPLESPQDEHGEGHDDANLPWFVLCTITQSCQSKLL